MCSVGGSATLALQIESVQFSTPAASVIGVSSSGEIPSSSATPGKAAYTRFAFSRSWSTFFGSAQNWELHSMPARLRIMNQPSASLSHRPPPW